VNMSRLFAGTWCFGNGTQGDTTGSLHLKI
jgi:hypothetical protein